MKYCGNYCNWLQFPNSKKNSFHGIYMRMNENCTYSKKNLLKNQVMFLTKTFQKHIFLEVVHISFGKILSFNLNTFFLCISLTSFVSPDLKLHNRYCNTEQWADFSWSCRSFSSWMTHTYKASFLPMIQLLNRETWKTIQSLKWNENELRGMYLHKIHQCVFELIFCTLRNYAEN